MSKVAEDLTRIAGLDIVKAEDAERWIKLLVYGDAGSGKSWLVASAEDVPEMKPVLFIDMEGGIDSISRKWPGINVVRLKDTTDPQGRVIKTAWDQLAELYNYLSTREHPYKTVILDSVTEAYSLCMRWVMKLLLEKKPDRDPDIADKREYAKARSRVHLMMRSFRDLECNVLMTALKDVKINNDTGAVINYIPGLPGKLAYEVGAFMSQLHYLYVEQEKGEVVRKMLTLPANKYLAKDRSDGLETVVDNPSMMTLAKVILRKEETKPGT